MILDLDEAHGLDRVQEKRAALDRMRASRVQAPNDSMPLLEPTRLGTAARAQLIAFLNALTDPCLKDRGCFGRWVPAASEAPDEHQLNAVGPNGSPL